MQQTKRKKNQVLFPLLAFVFLLSSCKDNEKKVAPGENEVLAASGINCFTLDSSKVNIYLRNSTPGTGYEEIILQFSFQNILASDGSIGVISYFAEDHSEHAIDKDSIKLTEITNSKCLKFKKDETYFVSNNYILVSNIKAILKGNESIYTYLKFTPMIADKGKASKHIFFNIKAYDKNDKELTPVDKLTVGDDDTKPSPPAKPD